MRAMVPRYKLDPHCWTGEILFAFLIVCLSGLPHWVLYHTHTPQFANVLPCNINVALYGYAPQYPYDNWFSQNCSLQQANDKRMCVHPIATDGKQSFPDTAQRFTGAECGFKVVYSTVLANAFQNLLDGDHGLGAIVSAAVTLLGILWVLVWVDLLLLHVLYSPAVGTTFGGNKRQLSSAFSAACSQALSSMHRGSSSVLRSRCFGLPWFLLRNSLCCHHISVPMAVLETQSKITFADHPPGLHIWTSHAENSRDSLDVGDKPTPLFDVTAFYWKLAIPHQISAMHTLGDGNCYWRAISKSTNRQWYSLKKQIICYLKKQSKFQPELMQEVRKLGARNAWANETAIQASAACLARPICVISSDRCIMFKPSRSVNPVPIFIRHSGTHFSVLHRGDGMHLLSSCARRTRPLQYGQHEIDPLLGVYTVRQQFVRCPKISGPSGKRRVMQRWRRIRSMIQNSFYFEQPCFQQFEQAGDEDRLRQSSLQQMFCAPEHGLPESPPCACPYRRVQASWMCNFLCLGFYISMCSVCYLLGGYEFLGHSDLQHSRIGTHGHHVNGAACERMPSEGCNSAHPVLQQRLPSNLTCVRREHSISHISDGHNHRHDADDDDAFDASIHQANHIFDQRYLQKRPTKQNVVPHEHLFCCPQPCILRCPTTQSATTHDQRIRPVRSQILHVACLVGGGNSEGSPASIGPTLIDSLSDATTVHWIYRENVEHECGPPRSPQTNASDQGPTCYDTDYELQFEIPPKEVIYVANTASECSSVQRFLCLNCSPVYTCSHHEPDAEVRSVPDSIPSPSDCEEVLLPSFDEELRGSDCSAPPGPSPISLMQTWSEHASQSLAQREFDWWGSDFWDRWSIDDNGAFTHKEPYSTDPSSPHLRCDAEADTASPRDPCNKTEVESHHSPLMLQAHWEEWSLDSGGHLQPARTSRKRRRPSEATSLHPSRSIPASQYTEVMDIDGGVIEEPPLPLSPSSHPSLMDPDMLRWAFDISGGGGGKEDAADNNFQPTRQDVAKLVQKLKCVQHGFAPKQVRMLLLSDNKFLRKIEKTSDAKQLQDCVAAAAKRMSIHPAKQPTSQDLAGVTQAGTGPSALPNTGQKHTAYRNDFPQAADAKSKRKGQGSTPQGKIDGPKGRGKTYSKAKGKGDSFMQIPPGDGLHSGPKSKGKGKNSVVTYSLLPDGWNVPVLDPSNFTVSHGAIYLCSNDEEAKRIFEQGSGKSFPIGILAPRALDVGLCPPHPMYAEFLKSVDGVTQAITMQGFLHQITAHEVTYKRTAPTVTIKKPDHAKTSVIYITFSDEGACAQTQIDLHAGKFAAAKLWLNTLLQQGPADKILDVWNLQEIRRDRQFHIYQVSARIPSSLVETFLMLSGPGKLQVNVPGSLRVNLQHIWLKENGVALDENRVQQILRDTKHLHLGAFMLRGTWAVRALTKNMDGLRKQLGREEAPAYFLSNVPPEFEADDVEALLGQLRWNATVKSGDRRWKRNGFTWLIRSHDTPRVWQFPCNYGYERRMITITAARRAPVPIQEPANQQPPSLIQFPTWNAQFRTGRQRARIDTDRPTYADIASSAHRKRAKWLSDAAAARMQSASLQDMDLDERWSDSDQDDRPRASCDAETQALRDHLEARGDP